MIERADSTGGDTAPHAAEPEEGAAMAEARLRELMPRAVRGDLAAIDGVLDILARRDRGQEEWMRWLWPARDAELGREPGPPA